MRKRHQILPNSGPEREALREKGQFWTPDWVAEAMVSYVLAGEPGHIFDPAVGAGVFLHAAKTITREKSSNDLKLLGTEIDPGMLQEAQQHGLSESDLSEVMIRDFILDPPDNSFKAIVANPPYIRHHRLSSKLKVELKKISINLIGKAIDGRAGLHIFFLLRALQLLEKDGRLAFIMPADTSEGVFASTLWKWITKNYRLEAVITFSPDASPFPGVDTNVIIFMIRNEKQKDRFFWAKCTEPDTPLLKAWVRSGFKSSPNSAMEVHERLLSEGLRTGLSRPPLEKEHSGAILLDFASVMRGIATGANDFFFLTVKQAEDLKIPDEFLIPAIGRTRDAPGEEITSELLEKLAGTGRPTLLFSPDGRAIGEFPPFVRDYLRKGEEMGLPERPLISMRNPWYRMETRPAPPILFAYLGRRNVRFIRNAAGVVPLTGFLCVYPNKEESNFVDKLFKVLSHPLTLANLPLVGKSYGAGAVKVEPRALEKLPIPADVLSEAELKFSPKAGQIALPI